MIKRLRKFGNSWGVLFPVDVIQALDWQKDGNLELTVEEDRVIIQKPPEPKETKKIAIFGKRKKNV